jgi:hypothetical protein
MLSSSHRPSLTAIMIPGENAATVNFQVNAIKVFVFSKEPEELAHRSFYCHTSV